MPIGVLYGRISDVDMLERLALRRGIEVQHRASTPRFAAGAVWDVRFHLRGRDRTLVTTLTGLEAPHSLRVEAVGTGLDAALAVDLVALSRSRTRLALDFVIRPRSMPARLLVQTMKLSRRRLKQTLTDRLEGVARRIENDYRRAL
ncbi:hypothetical protein SAMN04515673_105154 [Poseidonocella sedimentorum]|uniref:Polyketide cyclase / dehydrase and lipid transport n=1 Tax=Poseidonocella sedimentorum TaxID=871652 RepID=A0A1I6DU08_9RHOB|nr:hypothetical protein SAMN04515673_105154 [Poseidonocella sedimentorum]